MPACGGSSEQTLCALTGSRMDFLPLHSFLLFIKAHEQSGMQQELEHAGAQFTGHECAQAPVGQSNLLVFSLLFCFVFCILSQTL